jgi:hypothetical protein
MQSRTGTAVRSRAPRIFWGPELALPLTLGVRLRDVSALYLNHTRDNEVLFEHLEHIGEHCRMPSCEP